MARGRAGVVAVGAISPSSTIMTRGLIAVSIAANQSFGADQPVKITAICPQPTQKVHLTGLP